LFAWIIPGIFFLLFTGCTKKNQDSPNDSAGTVTDIDGNIYHTVRICSKLWMAENLKVTRFNDGSLIPCVTDSTIWDTLHSPAFCWYKNDENSYRTPYGALYNWYAVNSGKIAPEGWHVASIIEWDQMITCIGGDSAAGNKLKEAGTSHWESPNDGATNETGFTALPAGYRDITDSFSGMGFITFFWSSSGNTFGNASYVSLYYLHSYPQLNICDLQEGFSVRCIKD
jgi:uncharacterized protein (TIGR02145 family)